MRSHVEPSTALLLMLLRGLLVMSLCLWLTACAVAPAPAVRPVRCVHPVIDPYTNDGLPRAVQAYGEALNLCNSLNGFTLEETTNGNSSPTESRP